MFLNFFSFFRVVHARSVKREAVKTREHAAVFLPFLPFGSRARVHLKGRVPALREPGARVPCIVCYVTENWPCVKARSCELDRGQWPWRVHGTWRRPSNFHTLPPVTVTPTKIRTPRAVIFRCYRSTSSVCRQLRGARPRRLAEFARKQIIVDTSDWYDVFSIAEYLHPW